MQIETRTIAPTSVFSQVTAEGLLAFVAYLFHHDEKRVERNQAPMFVPLFRVSLAKHLDLRNASEGEDLAIRVINYERDKEAARLAQAKRKEERLAFLRASGMSPADIRQFLAL